MAEDKPKTTTDTEARDAFADAGIATPEQNAKLKHSVELDADRTPGKAEKNSVTTRDDTLDQGVPMLQGSPDEPQGPEDAFGEGSKRGDYSQRTGGVQSFEARPNPDGGKPITDGDGNVVDYEPNTILVPQVPRASDQGEVEGEKGGVTTGPDGRAGVTV